MKRILTLTLVVCLLAPAAYAEVRGSWTGSIRENHPGRLQLNLRRRADWNTGSTYLISDLSRLTSAQINATVQTPVQFEMRREAGLVAFEGVFKQGEGAGHFTFTPNFDYLTTLRGMGLEPERDSNGKRDREDELFSLAVHDVSTAFIRTMRAEGLNVPLDEYVGLRALGVTREYIHEMRSLRLQDGPLTADDLMGLRAVGVTPQYVATMRGAFPDLSLDDLQGMKAVGVTTEYIRAMRDAGIRIGSADDVMSMKAVGVTPQYIAAIRGLFPDAGADDIQSMKAVGVTPEYIRALRAAGVRVDSADDATSMKAVGVTVKLVEQLAAAGYKNLTADELTRMAAVGVDADFIRAMSKYRDNN